MNKVFKVIWSEARNAYVVVSEMAKSHGTKSCSTKKLLAMLIATGVMTCASVAPVMAEDAVNLAPDATKIAIGEGAVASGKGSVVAIGQKASASGEGSVAIGEEAVASGLVGIAIGRDAVASGVDSIAIGSDTKATQKYSVAVGNDIGFTAYAGTAVGQQAYASGDNATAIGTMTNIDTEYKASHGDWRKAGAQSTAIGAYAGSWGEASTAVGGYSKAEGKLATAIGYNSQANVDYGTALGDYSEVKAGWGVAIGASSVADRKSRVVGLYAPDEDKDSLTWKANAGAVSVGSSVEGEEITRQITNVAAGSADTDAVNVAQLNDVKAAAGKKVSLVDGENTKAILVKDDATGTQYKVDVDLSKYAKTEDVAVVYNNNKTSLRSTNATLQTSSKEEEAVDSIALGKDASAVKESVAIGNGASVVEGSNGLGGVALGYKAHAGYKGTSLGSNAISGREGTTLVGANTNSGSLYTTVVGTDSVINSSGAKYLGMVNVQGATATVVGSKNTVDNQNNKVYSGVANNIMGAANTIKSSNGITIQGSGNTVTDAYKDMDIDLWGDGLAILGGDYSVLAKKQSGAIAVVGGANNVSKQTDSTVIGYDNKLTGDEEKGSHDVFMAGSHNRLNNVSDSIVMGNKNAITGVSNVISFGHQNEITANNAVAIGSGAGVSAEGGVALGAGSVADRANAVSVGSTGANRQIINVAAGTEGTDAVNVSQLQKVSDTANAGWNLYTNGVATEATNVKPGEYVGFSGDKNISVSHDGTKVQVKLNENIDVNSIKTNALNAKYNLSVGTANENGTVPFLVNSTGAFYAANNNFSVDKYGKVIATAGEIGNVVLQNGVYTGNSALRDGELYLGDASGNYSQITPKSAKLGQVTIDEKGNMAGVNSIKTNALNAKYNLSVGTMAENGIMPFLVNSTGAFYAANNNFSVDKYGKVIATAGEIGNVVLQNGVYTGNSALRDGELYVGDASGNYSQITTTGAKLGQVTIAADGKISGVAAGVADTDAVNVSQLNAVKETANKGWNLSTNGGEASKVAPDATVDFSGDKNISVSHDGTKVQVELNKNIDVNYVQTNALNAKYNLSVGTANENGTVPFLVNSTGAFYAANNNFSVDKYGKVIATAGEIGNVVLQNGVYTGNSALRDGELYLGDASGNYSQITPKSAKLGQVTIDEKGNMAGVNSIKTNALNAKYNLSVGTMAENGIMPFLVNSTGAFYAANNNFSVDKYGKVIATAGEIGNVVLQNGVYTGNSALRDGELKRQLQQNHHHRR